MDVSRTADCAIQRLVLTEVVRNLQHAVLSTIERAEMLQKVGHLRRPLPAACGRFNACKMRPWMCQGTLIVGYETCS